MSESGSELGPGNSQSFTRVFFERALEAAGDDIGEALGAIDNPFDAVAFTYGYRDRMVEEGAEPTEAHKLAIARIHGHLAEGSYGDSAVLLERQAFWTPVFDAIKLKEDLGSSWERTRDAVHFFDGADEHLLRGGLEQF